MLFVPLLDLLMAIVRRTRRGESPFSADKMHLHHRLLEIGHSQRRAVLLIYLWAAVIAFGAVALTLFDVLVVVWGIGVGLLVALLVSAIPRLRDADRPAAQYHRTAADGTSSRCPDHPDSDVRGSRRVNTARSPAIHHASAGQAVAKGLLTLW